MSRLPVTIDNGLAMVDEPDNCTNKKKYKGARKPGRLNVNLAYSSPPAISQNRGMAGVTNVLISSPHRRAPSIIPFGMAGPVTWVTWQNKLGREVYQRGRGDCLNTRHAFSATLSTYSCTHTDSKPWCSV